MEKDRLQKSIFKNSQQLHFDKAIKNLRVSNKVNILGSQFKLRSRVMREKHYDILEYEK